MKYPILLPNIFNYPFTYESDLDLKIRDEIETKLNAEMKELKYLK